MISAEVMRTCKYQERLSTSELLFDCANWNVQALVKGHTASVCKLTVEQNCGAHITVDALRVVKKHTPFGEM